MRNSSAMVSSGTFFNLSKLLAGAGVAALLSVAASAPASAGTVTETYNFTLGGFTDVGDVIPEASPYAGISGSFTVTFDPTQNYDNDTTDLVVHSYNGPGLDSVFGFTYDATLHDLFFGGIENDSSTIYAGTNDLVIAYNVTNLMAPQYISCAQPGISCGLQTGNAAYDAVGYSLAQNCANGGDCPLWIISAQASTINAPEPGPLALLGVGLLALGGLGLRRKFV